MVEVTVEKTSEVDVEIKKTGVTEVSVEGPVYPCRCSEDYDKLKNKPKINGITVEGSKLASEYGLQDKLNFCSSLDIYSLFK